MRKRPWGVNSQGREEEKKEKRKKFVFSHLSRWFFTGCIPWICRIPSMAPFLQSVSSDQQVYQRICWCSNEVLGVLTSSWALPASPLWPWEQLPAFSALAQTNLIQRSQLWPQPSWISCLLAPVVEVLWWCQDPSFLRKSIPGPPGGGKKFENIKKKKKKDWKQEGEEKQKGKRTERISG